MQKLRVLFVIDKIGFLEILSIPTLSAVAKRAGHQVALIEFGRNESKALREVETYAPHVVAYSICSNETDRFLAINSRIKSRVSCFSIFGGSHPTFFPDLIGQDQVDAICRGEGDRAFPCFLDHIRTDGMHDAPNFSIKLPSLSFRFIFPDEG